MVVVSYKHGMKKFFADDYNSPLPSPGNLTPNNSCDDVQNQSTTQLSEHNSDVDVFEGNTGPTSCAG